MRPMIPMLILLAFPVLEAVLLFKLAGLFGWWLLLYLVLAAIFGWVLIMDERMVVFGRIVQTMEQGRHPLFALFASARKMVAGVLLIVPGVISDAIALLLLLSLLIRPRKAIVRDDVIEGEWRRED